MKAPQLMFLVGAMLVFAVGFAIGGQLAGAALFARLQELPDSVVDVTTLYRYWQAYADVKSVKRSLSVCNLVAAIITAIPFVFVAVFLARRQLDRELHGSARFATTHEIRKSGLVERKQ